MTTEGQNFDIYLNFVMTYELSGANDDWSVWRGSYPPQEGLVLGNVEITFHLLVGKHSNVLLMLGPKVRPTHMLPLPSSSKKEEVVPYLILTFGGQGNALD